MPPASSAPRRRWENCRQGCQGRRAVAFRPAQGQARPEMSLKPLVEPLSQGAGRPVAFAEDCIGAAGRGGRRDAEATAACRCWRTCASTPRRRRTIPAFAEAAGGLGDIYVNDAFSVAHRAHASTEGLAERLPAAAGPADAGRARGARHGAGRSAAAGGGDRRRRQGLDQARPAGQSGRQGRRADDRRRHGQHLPVRARHRRRQVAVRARYGRTAREILAKAKAAERDDRAAGRCGDRRRVQGDAPHRTVESTACRTTR